MCIIMYYSSTPLFLQIAEIRDIRGKVGDDAYRVQVAWFYRPEEIVGGRKVS